MTNNVQKLLIALGENHHEFKPDIWTNQNMYVSGNKKWIGNVTPIMLLKKNIKESIESLLTLNQDGVFYKEFPDKIETPNYGDLWGRTANYIEINNRAIAEMQGNKTKNGILSSIKILPAIPPSAKSWANCIILSQIFPNIFGDGFNKNVNEENSLYGIRLNTGYSQNIIDFDIINNINSESQILAFNDLAHVHGLKTGFRTVISADQIKVASMDKDDETFNWDNPQHVELFINEHTKLIKLGFEAIFIDSAKHIGGYEMENYSGVGNLPGYQQMQYILHEIRKRSQCTSISFVGEKTNADFDRYKTLGLTTGTAFIDPDNYDSVKEWAIKLKYNKEYAPGVEVSNDNDQGGRSYENRLHRINTSLFAYEFPSDKLASFMQMEDLFPLRYDTSTHHLMMTNPSFSLNHTKESHWENLFAKQDGQDYNAKVAELFSHSLNL